MKVIQIARKDTMLKAIDACGRVKTESGRMYADVKTKDIIEGVLTSNKPNLALIEKWIDEGFR